MTTTRTCLPITNELTNCNPYHQAGIYRRLLRLLTIELTNLPPTGHFRDCPLASVHLLLHSAHLLRLCVCTTLELQVLRYARMGACQMYAWHMQAHCARRCPMCINFHVIMCVSCPMFFSRSNSLVQQSSIAHQRDASTLTDLP